MFGQSNCHLTKWKPPCVFRPFVRSPCVHLADKDAKFPAEKDRYHLFVAYACPWAHRTLMTRAIKGLEDVISYTVVHPIWGKTRPGGVDQHTGWVFADPNGEPMKNAAGEGGPFPPVYPGNEPEPFFNAKTVRELYELAADTDGKYTVPILWDKKQKTIVRYVR
jgi:putative glutathione S-transferase